PDKNLKLAHAFPRFARALENSASGQLDQANSDRGLLAAESTAIGPDVMLGFNSARELLDLAQLMLDASIARRRHDLTHSADLLRKAALKEDALNYDEPPDWYLPPREALG